MLWILGSHMTFPDAGYESQKTRRRISRTHKTIFRWTPGNSASCPAFKRECTLYAWGLLLKHSLFPCGRDSHHPLISFCSNDIFIMTKLLSGQGLLWPESFCRAGRTALLRVMVTEKKTRATLWLVLKIFPKSHLLDQRHQTQLQEWMQHSWISIWNHMGLLSYLPEAQTILGPLQHWWGSYIVF